MMLIFTVVKLLRPKVKVLYNYLKIEIDYRQVTSGRGFMRRIPPLSLSCDKGIEMK